VAVLSIELEKPLLVEFDHIKYTEKRGGMRQSKQHLTATGQVWDLIMDHTGCSI
jgi:hypothetical protein